MTVRSSAMQVARATGMMPLLSAGARGWFWFLKKTSSLRGVSPIDAVYTSRYFQAESDMTAPTAPAVVDCLMRAFAPRSLVDIGCGTAVYLREFQRRGVEVYGYEGSSHAIAAAQIDPHLLQQVDLSTVLAPRQQFDLAICFEVGEHLPDAASLTFVRNIAALAPRIAFSAAQPGQGGVDHVNEQPSAYWIARFAQAGCRHDEAATARLRDDFRRHGCVWWLERNALVFERIHRGDSALDSEGSA